MTDPNKVREYVESYRFEFDGGASYAPNCQDKAMLEDALEGFLAQLTDEDLLAEQERRRAIMSSPA